MSELYAFNVSYLDDENDEYEDSFEEILEPLEKIAQYMKGNTLRRLQLINSFPDIARSLGYEKTLQEVIPVLNELKNDKESSVRQALVQQTVELAKFFHKTHATQQVYADILHHLLPIVAAHTADENDQVRQATIESLLKISKLLQVCDFFPYLLPIIRDLAENTQEEYRIECLRLLGELAPIMGNTLCIDFAIPHFKTLANDPVFRVRKSVAYFIGNICKIVGRDETSKTLLPIYETLANDHIWGVRKASVQSLVSISESVGFDERMHILTDIFCKFSQDSSRWVSYAASEALGPFIATFKGGTVPPVLLKCFQNFLSDADQIDRNNIYHCAFYFPAVLYTLGPEGWDQLSHLYNNLVSDKQIYIRRSLAFSFHEIINILGTEITQKSLIPTFNAFLNDIDEVRIGVITNISKVLNVFSKEIRMEHLTILNKVAKEEKWRIRKLLARQLGSLVLLYPSNVVYESIIPLYNILLKDPVGVVRKTAINSFSIIVQALRDTPYYEDFFASTHSLTENASFNYRQLFALICEKAMDELDNEQFEKWLCPVLYRLCVDKVPNVRFIVARCIRKLMEMPYFSSKSDLQQICTTMKKDSDGDVLYYLKDIDNS